MIYLSWLIASFIILMKTAAIIIIGNEILSGRIQDTNSSYLSTELRGLGVDVRRVSVIPDDVEVIASEVRIMSESHDYVFTSGGIGPTHDDMTISGVARGFGLKTVVDQGILDFVRSKCGDRLSDVAARIAELPEGAEVIEVDGMNFPPVKVRNVYIFPGIPELLKKKFTAIKERFRSDRPFLMRKVYINIDECFVADHLDRVDGGFPDVMVGSYPRVDMPDYKVVLTLESRDRGQLDRAYEMLMGLLPEDAVVSSE
jgi:molybdenum cofactor synthesis domain-containing protein